VVRRHRRPPHGLSCQGAFRNRQIPVHRLTRCVVSGVLAGSVGSSPVSRSRSLPLLELLVLSFGFPSSDVGVNVHSRFRAAVPRGTDGTRLRRQDATPVARSVLVGSHHLDGFLRSRFPACCSRYRIWGSPGLPCIDRRSSLRFSSDRARGFPWRTTLRRFRPRRQPSRITAGCSPPAVHRLSRHELSSVARGSFVPTLGARMHSGWAACPPPRLSVAAFLPFPATSGGCRSSGIGSVPVSRPAARPPVPDPHARLPSRGRFVGLPASPFGHAETPQASRRFRDEVLLDLRSLPLAVSGSRCTAEDSLARWLSGPPEILGIPDGSVVPSPSVDTRPAFLPSVSAGRLQGLAPPTSPGRSAGLATHGPPVPSLGLFPLRGSTRPTDGGSLRFLRPPPGLPCGHPGPGFHSARLR